MLTFCYKIKRGEGRRRGEGAEGRGHTARGQAC